jgi:hypothetical protein
MIYTSYYQCPRLRDVSASAQLVRISRGLPRFGAQPTHHYPALYPPIGCATPADYHAHLDALGVDGAELYASLDEPGCDVILLCFEARGKPCHRRWLADWIAAHGGPIIPEL